MGKAARIKQERIDGKDRRHTVVSKQTSPLMMNNPHNAEKKRRLNREEKSPREAD